MPRLFHHLILAISLAALTPHALAIDPGKEQKARQTEADLGKLRKRIDTLQADMKSSQRNRDSHSAQLEKLEQQVGETAKELHSLRLRMREQQRRLTGLQTEQKTSRQRLGGERAALAETLRSSYMAGQQERMQLLLTHDDPTTLSRMLTWHDYVQKARSRRINAVRRNLSQLSELGDNISAKHRQLAELERARATALKQLRKRRDAREKLLASATSELKAKANDLGGLQADEKALDKLLTVLQQALAESPVRNEVARPIVNRDNPLAALPKQAFSKLRGRLHWPAAGKRVQHFGSSRADGHMRWNGVLIEAPAGTDVRSVAHGRIAFADWLPRLGLVIIVEHDASYMSLYAHNQAVYRKVGDTVLPGEVIAAVGDSGGRHKPGLYFEIRQGRKPRNPAQWCKLAAIQ